MKKTTRLIACATSVAVLISSLFLYRTLELDRASAQSAFLEILNPAGEIVGPAGIQFDAGGNVYVGDSQGIVWEMEKGGAPRIYSEPARLHKSMATALARISSLAFDVRGNLYAACRDRGGGTVLRIETGTKHTRIFARDVGIAEHLVISEDSRYLWVSDSRRLGRLLRYPLGGDLPAQPDLVVPGLAYPGGVVFGKDERTLYAAETYSGDIVRIDITADGPCLSHVINLSGSFALGSLAGLAFDPRDTSRRFLYVAENLRGIFSVVDLSKQPVQEIKKIRLAQMGGRPCPSSSAIRDGFLYFTDIWSCSPFRTLLGVPKWHNHIYRFRVFDLSSLYPSRNSDGL